MSKQMEEVVKGLQEPLKVEDIEFRVQSINKGGYATIIVYKDSRTDMRRLDEVVGSLNWQKRYLRDNKNCVVSIRDSNGEWISKEDVGVSAQAEKEKSIASDSFKRACFNWGIGRELYDYPFIQVKLQDNEWTANGDKAKATWDLKIKEWVWITHFDENNKIKAIACKDQNGKVRFNWGTFPKP